ncbi:cytochrome P450 [Streptomyces monticola]|uniref:Cytochrome P450 n=1 Tax=Streptomyces monticola TaxID=2666263 RepID=A0ABW2JW41_9ACTN
MDIATGQSVTTADRESIITEVLDGIYTESGRANPYPLYDKLRALGPVVTAPNGTVLISGYAEQLAFMKDHRLKKHPGRRLAATGWPDWKDRPSLRLMFDSMMFLNPPEHTRLRRLVQATFTPGRVKGMRSVVEQITADMLDALPRGTVNWVEGFALPMPIAVVGALLGVPPADWPLFQSLAANWTLVLDDVSPETVERADPSAVEMEECIARLAHDRAKKPQDDLISAMVAAQGDDKLTRRELVTMAALLLVAGFETTSGLLSKGLAALLKHPEQADRLRTEPELAGPAIEELVRYDAPVQFVANRTAEEDLEVAGIKLAPGQPAWALIGAGNRDPKVFTRPDELILDRQEAAPLSYGGGIHYCIGAALARLEAQVALPAVLRKFPDIQLAGPPTPRSSHLISGFVSLPVTV